MLLIALLAGGHVLLEDVPGTGKTMAARAFARSVGASFNRIQCTPDLMPSDVLGVHFYSQKSGEFEFREGPLLAPIVLVDEVNRATPRTQSALLQAMEERTITVDGETRPLPQPFIVLATQNPIELEGTFPLPEAQLDRFLLRLRLGYPTEDDEIRVLRRFEAHSPLDALQPVVAAEELVRLSDSLPEVHVEDVVTRYLVRIIRATREHAAFELGARPRAPRWRSSAPPARWPRSRAGTTSGLTTSSGWRPPCSRIACCSARRRSCAAAPPSRSSTRSCAWSPCPWPTFPGPPPRRSGTPSTTWPPRAPRTASGSRPQQRPPRPPRNGRVGERAAATPIPRRQTCARCSESRGSAPRCC